MTGMTRRQLLRRLGLASATVAGLPLLRQVRAAAPTPAPASKHILILGAGLAGLSAAYELERKGFRTTLLEADRSHLGGRARTLRFNDGTYGEAGAMRIPTRHDLTRHYCKEMNLTLRPFILSNPDAYYFIRGTRVRKKDEVLLKPLFKLRPNEQKLSSDDLWAAAVSNLLKAFSPADKKALTSPNPQSPSYTAVDRLSLQQLFESAGLSQEAIEFMASTQGQEAELEYGCSESLREELLEVWTAGFDEIVGGTDTLPAALAKALKSPVRQGCEVTALSQTPTSVTATFTTEGRTESLAADACICTLPLPVLQRLDVQFSPEKHRAIRQLAYDSATKLLMTAKRRFWEADDKIYGGGSFTDLPTGSTYYPADNAASKDPAVSANPAVFLASYSWGMTARRLAAMPHAQRLDLAKRHLVKLHPQLAEQGMITNSASWAWDTHPWSGGAFAWFNPGQHTALHADLVKPEGRVHFAGEHASLAHTWMQGAFESALRCVTEITAGT